MKKRLWNIVLIILVLGIFLAGCEHYDKAGADKITEKGAEMMEAWLDENLPACGNG